MDAIWHKDHADEILAVIQEDPKGCWRCDARRGNNPREWAASVQPSLEDAKRAGDDLVRTRFARAPVFRQLWRVAQGVSGNVRRETATAIRALKQTTFG